MIDSDMVLSDEEDEVSHEMAEEDWDVDDGCPPCPSPARELTQILFPDSESSGEEGDWIVSDSEDITMSHTVGLDVCVCVCVCGWLCVCVYVCGCGWLGVGVCVVRASISLIPRLLTPSIGMGPPHGNSELYIVYRSRVS